MHHRNGFTLLEAMIGLFLISAVIMGIPAITTWLRHQGVSLAAAQLRADLQLARIMAINRKQSCAIVFDLPADNQYINSLSRHKVDLSGFRGGVHFLDQGPDETPMASKIEFNRRGMSTSVTPMRVFLGDQDHYAIFRIQVMAPGGIFVSRWMGDAWK